MKRDQFILSLGTGVFSILSSRSFPFNADIKTDEYNSKIPFQAVVPAALTAFDQDGSIDYPECKRHIKSLAEVNGVAAIMINGGAGFDIALTREERRKLLGQALETVGDQVKIIAAIRESEINADLGPLAKDAHNEGAHAIAVMPPAQSLGFSWEVALQRFGQTASHSDLPLVVYQTRYDIETLIRITNSFPIVAIKEGSQDPSTFELNMRSIREQNRNVAIWSTHSKWLLADLALGADGILSGMGSVAADPHVALVEAIKNSNLQEARMINDKIFPLTQVFYAPGQNAHVRMKYALMKLGRQKSDFVRSPYQPLNHNQQNKIDTALRESGLL